MFVRVVVVVCFLFFCVLSGAFCHKNAFYVLRGSQGPAGLGLEKKKKKNGNILNLAKGKNEHSDLVILLLCAGDFE